MTWFLFLFGIEYYLCYLETEQIIPVGFFDTLNDLKKFAKTLSNDKDKRTSVSGRGTWINEYWYEKITLNKTFEDNKISLLSLILS